MPPNSFIDNTMKDVKQKLISMDTVQLGDWYIKASQLKGYILLTMINVYNGKFVMQYVDDVHKANLIVEYVIEKGDL
jgi:hypothetical protein